MVGGRVVLKTLGKIIPLEISLPVEEPTETETSRNIGHELDSVSIEENSSEPETSEGTADPPEPRPLRRAAQRAQALRKDLISQDLL